MRKEVLIAIILGALLGLAIAFGVYRANLVLSPRQPITTQVTPQVSPTPPTLEILLITQPEDGSLVKADTISVAGKATKEATIVITTPVDEVIVIADSAGVFSGDVKLEGGANTILVTAISQEGETAEQERTVTYSTEFKEE